MLGSGQAPIGAADDLGIGDRAAPARVIAASRMRDGHDGGRRRTRSGLHRLVATDDSTARI